MAEKRKVPAVQRSRANDVSPRGRRKVTERAEALSGQTSVLGGRVGFLKKPVFFIPLVVIILAGLLYYFRGQFVVASVNGQPIWRFTLIRELENQAGKQTLDGLVTKTLVFQEAKKKNITVSEEELNQETQKLDENFKKQGGDLNQFLESQKMTQEEFQERIKLQKIVEKLVGDVEVTDQEVDDYLAKNKSFLPEGASEEELKRTAKEQLRQQKLNEKIQSWIKSLRDNAKVSYFS
ncbi:MAG: SurA N-terminal domain-containing protein [bacterium]|nr:SurA N-terminal domain-containing protein [bacterium]